MTKSALLLGASGLVGGHCLRFLLEDRAYGKVVAWVRKPLSLEHDKLEQRVVDFEHLASYAHLTKVNDVFCCLGTTIKKAGSQEAFRQVDFDYPLEIAKLASKNGVEQFLMITAMGANPRSRIFYNRVKGEVEAAITKLSFKTIDIFRPSLLLGEREERRLGEKIGEPLLKSLKFLLVGPWRKYRALEAQIVARAMVEVAKQNFPGVNIFESDRIERIGRGSNSFFEKNPANE
jgi:uncharacterized protein YbjT (DUF2867 family)